ncbi:phage tail protein I [Pseudomonas aeruginosa]
MSSRLLPPNRSSLERSLGDVLPAELPVPLRELHDPARCEAALLPYLAWTRSVDRWGPDWSDEAKRNAVATSFVLHQRKGTLTALRQVVEPIGALSEVTEWWQRSPTGVPGTFEITVDVSDRGIDEGTALELERLLDDVRPVSRHLTRLDLRITPVIRSRHGLAVTDGDTLEIFPWKQ